MSLSRVSCGIHLKELPLVLGAFIFFPCEGAPIVQAKFEALRLAPADQSVSHHVCHRCDCRVAPSWGKKIRDQGSHSFQKRTETIKALRPMTRLKAMVKQHTLHVVTRFVFASCDFLLFILSCSLFSAIIYRASSSDTQPQQPQPAIYTRAFRTEEVYTTLL